MIPRRFSDIGKADIDALVMSEVKEIKTLEYKQNLPGGTDSDKKEFLADVSSFANASGGDIIFGVEPALDSDGKTTGAPKSVKPLEGNSDQEMQRLENLIRTGIEPRIPVQIKAIEGWGDDGKRFVILLRIQKSFASPHVVTLGKSFRFYSRNSTGKYPLDVAEVRSAFLAMESQADRIRRFREERLGRILADETPVPISSNPRLVLHLVPIAPFLNNLRLDLSKITGARMEHLKPIACDSMPDYRYNLDGLLSFVECAGSRPTFTYCQLFWDGRLEAVFTYFIRPQGNHQVIDPVYEKHIMDSIIRYLGACKELELEPPIAVFLSLLGCKGAYMYIEDSDVFGLNNPIDRNDLILPDVIIDKLDADVPRSLKPIFDLVWNACGFPADPNYSEHGDWRPR